MAVQKSNLFFLFLLFMLTSCQKENRDHCPEDILSEYTDPDGTHVIIAQDGKGYLVDDAGCTFAEQMFSPGFLEAAYLFTENGVYLQTDEGPFPIANEFFEDFESYASFNDLFIFSLGDSSKWWNHFTCQSPNTPEVADYNAFRDCIWAGTCDFVDNRVELAEDPSNASNQVMKFTAVAPSEEMVTSKASFSSPRPFFRCGDDFWFEAKFYIAEGMPFSLMDFENSLFYGYPGPRLVLRSGTLAFENKFGEKANYVQDNPVNMPLHEWCTIKVHFRLNDQAEGLLELWQNNVLLISTAAYNLPSYHSVQNSLEVGISSTSEYTVLFVDDVRISASPL